MYTYSSEIEYAYDTRILFTKTCTLCRQILAHVIKLHAAILLGTTSISRHFRYEFSSKE